MSRRITTKIIFTGILGFISIVPTFSYADGDCNRFGGSCYVSGVGVLRTDEEPKPTLLTTVKRTINVVLSLLATIAMLIVMYGGFKMLTSGGDSKGYDAGLKILKNAAIGLAIIALSRIIVSLVFRFVDTAAEGNSMTDGTE